MGSIATISGKKGISHKATAIHESQRRTKTFSESKYGKKGKSMAKEWIKNTEHDLAKGNTITTATERRTPLKAVIEVYRTKVLPSHAKSSQPKEKTVLKRIEKTFGEETPFLAITGELLAEKVTEMRQDYSDDTIDKTLLQFQWLIRAAKIELQLHFRDDPYKTCLQILRHRGVPLVCTKRTRRIEETDQGSELDLLINFEHPGETLISHIIKFAVETGMRRGEIAALTWADIDLKKRIATIRRSKTDKKKCAKGRLVPLTTKAIETLMAVRQNETQSVFNMNPDSISRAFGKTCRRLGIKGLRFHDLRHEAVTRMLERGLSPAEVGTIAGQSLTTVMRYTHFRPEDLVAKMAAWDELEEGRV